VHDVTLPPVENVLKAHGTSASKPGQKWPARHARHRKPGGTLCFQKPAVHAHVNTSVTPVAVWFECAGHCAHSRVWCPGVEVFCHVLCGHSAQEVMPGSAAYVPARHSRHTSPVAAPTLVENFPGSQALQLDELKYGVNFPAAQGVHDSQSPYSPGLHTQSRSLPDPTLLELLSRQERQCEELSEANR
jgi:hypothetical protein